MNCPREDPLLLRGKNRNAYGVGKSGLKEKRKGRKGKPSIAIPRKKKNALCPRGGKIPLKIHRRKKGNVE